MNRNAPMIALTVLMSIGLVVSSTFAILQSQEIIASNDDINQLEQDLIDLQNQYDDLQGQYDGLQDDYDNLNEDYDSLNETFNDLEGNFTQLLEKYANLTDLYDALLEQYDELDTTYDELVASYNSLFADYETLREAFEDPLESPETPSYSEFKDWLDVDNTDQHEYVDDVWECGDFGAMLMTRAKEMNWRVRCVIMFYSYEGELGYGNILSLYGSGGHVLNLIECEDGIWYIEPQTDEMWYFSVGGIHIPFSVHSYYDFEDATGTVWDGHTFWTNFYSWFG